VLIILAVAPRWMAWLGYLSAGLIATGVLIPLGLEAASLTNFAGYVAWCLWLIAMAVILWRAPRGTADRPATSQAQLRRA
jgi:TRAP-type C4-dicarboxylate transport system permease small subunit